MMESEKGRRVPSGSWLKAKVERYINSGMGQGEHYGAGTWLRLAGKCVAIYVAEGECESYIAHQTRQGTLSRRYFLNQVPTGGFAFATPSEDKIEVILYCVTDVVVVPIFDVKIAYPRLTMEQGRSFWESLGRLLGARYVCQYAVYRYVDIAKDGSYTVPEGEAIRTTHRTKVSWIYLHKGQLAYEEGGKRKCLEYQGKFIPIYYQCLYYTVGETKFDVISTDVYWRTHKLKDVLIELDSILSFLCLDYNRRFTQADEAFAQRLATSAYDENILQVASQDHLYAHLGGSAHFAHTPETLRLQDRLVCLKAIAAALGVDDMDNKFAQLTAIGSDEALVENVALSMGLVPRRIHLEGKWWEQSTNCLLVTQEGCNLAIIPSSSNASQVFDPKTGTSQLLTEGLAAGIAQEAYEFTATVPRQVKGFWSMLKWAVLRSYSSDLLCLFLCCIFVGIIPIVVPLITSSLFADVIPSQDKQALIMLLQVLMVAQVSMLLVGVARQVAMLRIKYTTRMLIEQGLWQRLLKLPLKFFRQYQVGDLAMRMHSMGEVSENLAKSLSEGVYGLVFALWALVVMLYYNRRLTLIAVLLWLVYCVFVCFFLSGKYHNQRKLTEQSGVVAGKTLQLLKGLATIRLAAAEGRAFYLWATAYGREWQFNFKVNNWDKWLHVVQSAHPVLMNLLIFGAMYYLMEDTALGKEAVESSDLLGFNSALGIFGSSLTSFIPALFQLLTVKPIVERIQPVLTEPIEEYEQKLKIERLSGDIELNNVTFRYAPNAPLVLRNFSLHIHEGEFVGIVGMSGCGKSTLLKLLLRFEQPTEGKVLYDETDIEEVDIFSLRRRIGTVLQDDTILADSIYSNICGANALSMDEVWQVAKMAGIDEDIKAMPMQMYTVISEDGGNISGGQRQRILIARALAARPDVLIFDEATSSLDNKTQNIVAQSVAGLSLTRIVVAHRLSTIKHADRIIVMDEGRIIEAGSYAELMGLGGFFAELVSRQVLN